jgi:hypothetical protein
MGIHNFQQYIKKTYDGACRKKWLNCYDNLYIDLNHILHTSCYVSKNLDELMETTKEQLKNIIFFNKPTKRLIIIADGSAPLAKLILQRKRRLESVRSIDDNVSPHDAYIDRLNLNLTPCTKFMTMMERSIMDFVHYVENTYKIEVITFLSDAGEGEVKIKYQVLKYQKKYPDETHAIYSNDSDMILLLFTCEDLSKIYQIIRKEYIISFGKMYHMHMQMIFGNQPVVKDFTKEISQIKYDFVLINLLMGNDYLPKASFLKLENVWKAYQIIAPNRYIVRRDNQLIIDWTKGLIVCNNSDIRIDPIFFHDLIYNATKHTPKHLLKKFTFESLKDSLYSDYIKGLYWCFAMYRVGSCLDCCYAYDHRTAPHITGVMLSIMTTQSYHIEETRRNIDQGLYGILLIPEKAKNLLNKEQQMVLEKMLVKHPIIYEEGRCEKCKNYHKQMSELNREYKSIMKKTNNPDPDFDDPMPNPDHTNALTNDTLTNDTLTKKITTTSKEYSEHRETHPKLTGPQIVQMNLDYLMYRKEIRENMDFETDELELTGLDGIDFDNKKEIWKPKPKNILKKKLF